MLKPVNTLTSLSTLVVLFAMIQALDPIISKVIADGRVSPSDWWLIGRTGVTTLIAIAIKSKENPIEFTPKGLPGDSLEEVKSVLNKLKEFDKLDV